MNEQLVAKFDEERWEWVNATTGESLSYDECEDLGLDGTGHRYHESILVEAEHYNRA